MSDDPYFDEIDPAGVPNIPDPYDDTVPVGERLGSQRLYEGMSDPEVRPKRSLLRPIGKRLRRHPATPEPAPLQAVQQSPPQPTSKARTVGREVTSTLMEVSGLAAISVGSWMVYHPAGWIIAGISAVLLGVATGR